MCDISVHVAPKDILGDGFEQYINEYAACANHHNAFAPIFGAKTLRCTIDSNDPCVVSPAGTIFFNKDSDVYKPTRIGDEKPVEAYWLTGQTKKIFEVVHDGFKYRFTPSLTDAIKICKETKGNCVYFDSRSNEYSTVFFDELSSAANVLSALLIINSKTHFIERIQNENDEKVNFDVYDVSEIKQFFEEIQYIIKLSKDKKWHRVYDLAQSIIKVGMICAYSGYLMARLLFSMLSEADIHTINYVYSIASQCCDTPCYYMNDFNFFLLQCKIVECFSKYWRQDSESQLESQHCNVDGDCSRRRDPMRTISKQAKIAMWYAEVARNGGKNPVCNMCGKTIATFDDFEADHVYPWSKGGKTTPENLQVLCSKCNRIKSDRV